MTATPPALATEAARSHGFPTRQFNQREKQLLASVKVYVDAQAAAQNQLAELTDVLITAAAANQILSFDSVSSKWKNQGALAPTSGTLATLAGNEDLSNKRLKSSCQLVDATDPSKSVQWNLAGATANADLVIVSSQTADHNLTIPVLAGDDTVATLAVANTFTAANTHAADEIFLNEKGIKFREATGGGTDAVLVKAPAALAADATVTLPGVVTTFPATQGAAGEVMTNNGSGVLAWAAQSFLQQTASVTISSAEMLALNAAPKTLVAAPASGHIIVVDSIEFFLDFGSAAYARDGGNEELVVQYSGGTDIHAFANATDAFLTAGADARRIVVPTIYNSAAANFDPTTGDAEAVVATITNSEVITGDSPVKVVVRYRDVTLAA